MLTPNLGEFRQVAGRWNSEAELADKAEKLRQALEVDALLVTRSEEGMTLFQKDGALHVAALAKEVYDVSGAGDTVIATLGVMLAAGLDLADGRALGQQGGRHRRRQARHGRGPARRAFRLTSATML